MPPPTPVWHPCRDAPAILTVGSGVVEGRNLIIKQVKRQGFGYTNPHNYRLRVLYRCA